MLVDDVTIRVRAGNGGRGSVAFQKVRMALGPTGGSGGHGSDVYFEAVSDIGALSQFRFQKVIEGDNGGDGRAQFVDGARGRDLFVKVPIGTVIHNLDTGVDRELVRVGEKLLIAKGGGGGKGNFLYRSSTNTTPKEFGPGYQGDSYNVRLELKLIADVGFVGLPNVGKSSLLNTLTAAKAKVANYKFTTLEPNLGTYYDLILADIPGLIEGASEGKGLGVKFLRHVARTRVLFHLVSAESDNVIRDYAEVRTELGLFDKEMLKKEEYVFLSKSDVLDAVELKNKIADLEKESGSKVIAINLIDEPSLNKVKAILEKITKTK